MRKKLKKYREDIIIVISILVILFLFIAYGEQMLDILFHGNSVVIDRLNADSNPCKSGTEYFYLINGQIRRYSFEDAKITLCPIEGYVYDFASWNGRFIYYTCKSGEKREVRMFDYETGQDEQLFSSENIDSLYGGDEAEIKGVWLDIYNDVFLLRIEGEQGRKIYLCPAGEGAKEHYIDADSLFLGGRTDKSIFTPFRNILPFGDGPEEITYEGMVLKRYYDMDTGSYQIMQIRDEESGCNIFSVFQCFVNVEGENIFISEKSDGGMWTYSVEGQEEEYRISCLEDEKYSDSYTWGNKLAVEDGEIIGMVTVPKFYYINSGNPQRSEIRYEILFKLNPKTGESSIIYKTGGNRTRIIGYKDGTVYLMKNYKIYEEPIKGGRRKFLFALPKFHDYEIDWQGDYLVVFYSDYKKHYLFYDTPSNDEAVACYKVG